MKIAVIGNGLQACVAASLFASVGNDVVMFDSNINDASISKEPGLNELTDEQLKSDRLTYLDRKENTSLDYDFVLLTEVTTSEVLLKYQSQLESSIKCASTFIILSPSKIGEANALSQLLSTPDKLITVCSIPLLVREGLAINDFSRPQNIILGCDEQSALSKVKSLFYPFNRVKDTVKVVSTKEAEFSCFAGNAMLATRLSFMNEMASLAERVDVDIEVVRECIGSDPRIGRDYLYPGCGYGGQALEDNVAKVAKELKNRSDDLGLLETVAKINERQKDLLFRKIWNFFASELEGKRVAVWGAAFKPGSANITGAPAIKLIESLVAQNALVSVYDPLAKTNLKKHFDGFDSVTIAESSTAALDNSDVLAICTEWKEFWSPNFDLLIHKLKFKAIFDGRNIFEPEHVSSFGLKYFAIGRGKKIV